MTRDTLENLEHNVVGLLEERTGRLLGANCPKSACFGINKYARLAMDAILYYDYGKELTDAGKIEIGTNLAYIVMRVQFIAARLGIDLCEQIHETFNDTATRLGSSRRMQY